MILPNISSNRPIGVAIKPSSVPHSRSRANANDAAIAGTLNTMPTNAGMSETV